MIEIVLNNGVVLKNDPEMGINLDTVEDIQECLDETGAYRLKNELGYHIVRKEEVKEVRHK